MYAGGAVKKPKNWIVVSKLLYCFKKEFPMENKHIFTSYGFNITLAILLLNDFILKDLYGNWLTGKLSDFAGLFVFSLFFSAYFITPQTTPPSSTHSAPNPANTGFASNQK